MWAKINIALVIIWLLLHFYKLKSILNFLAMLSKLTAETPGWQYLSFHRQPYNCQVYFLSEWRPVYDYIQSLLVKRVQLITP